MQTIYLDISIRKVPLAVFAKQGDVGRKFKAVIMDGGVSYTIPEGAQLSVWYSGSSGEGNYTAIGERSAFHVQGNTVEVEMIAQMLTNKGGGMLCLVINTADGEQVGLWNVPYAVEEVPGIDSPEAGQHFTAFSEAVAKIAERGTDSAMEIGVEYPTGEKCMGKSVYTKLVSLGGLPSSATKRVTDCFSAATYVFGCTGFAADGSGTGITIPMMDHEGNAIGLWADNSGAVCVAANYDASGYTSGYAIVKYLKD